MINNKTGDTFKLNSGKTKSFLSIDEQIDLFQ